MENYFDNLKELLQEDNRFFSEDGVFLRNAVYEAAMKLDEKLIHLLLKNEDTAKRFFKKVDDVVVFDNVGFSWVINNHEFLPNSYTRYKNKIGLIDEDGDSIASSGKVSLAFPYKDCVLLGGQTKEEQKRDEVFYNKSLAPNEIDRLFYPKVLKDFRKYSAQGRDSVDIITNTDNLVIKGNNLLVLSSLAKKYDNKVRMMYWDVPYNTDSDSFNYNDRFSRSSWLLFIKNRVEVALPMLSDNGGVFLIQCSFHQYAYLKVLLDEVIGNYVMTFNVLVRHPDRTLTSDKPYNDVVEYVLVYSKNPKFKMPKIEEEKTVDDYTWTVEEISNGTPIEFDGRKATVFTPDQYKLVKCTPSKENFKVMTVRGSIKEKNSSGRFYVKYLQPIEKDYPPKTLFKVENIGDDMYDYRYFYLPPEGNKNGAYLQGMPTSSNKTYKPYPNFLDFVQSYNVVNDEGTVEFRNGKKPEDLIAFFMEIFTAEGDLVLDAFGGSATTAAVALKLNRQFIISEQMDYIEDTTVGRLLGLLNGAENDLLPEYEYNGQGSFVYFELAKSNQFFVDKIQSAKENELADIWQDILNTGFINCTINPSLIDMNDEAYVKLPLDDKRKLLIELLDLNQLYINYCDIEDQSYDISEEEKRLTHSFYKEA